MSAARPVSVADLHTFATGHEVTVAGALRDVTPRVTVQGRTWATAYLVDTSGSVEILAFPHTYGRAGERLVAGRTVTVDATVQWSVPAPERAGCPEGSMFLTVRDVREAATR